MTYVHCENSSIISAIILSYCILMGFSCCFALLFCKGTISVKVFRIHVLFLYKQLILISFFCLLGTRESAFLYALSAAAISHTIARACTSGDLRLCSCGPIPGEIPEPGYRWGGCADNLHYGLLMGSKFSDAPMKMKKKSGSNANKLMHLHNSEVGRQVSGASQKPCGINSLQNQNHMT